METFMLDRDKHSFTVLQLPAHNHIQLLNSPTITLKSKDAKLVFTLYGPFRKHIGTLYLQV